MRFAIVICFALASSLLACSGNNSPAPPTTDTSISDSPAPITTISTDCYQNQAGTDSIYLKLTDSLGNIYGDLEYRLTGKDANKGTIICKMHGDTLIADYRFLSEGQSSVREIAFLRRDSSLIEGFGPVNEINGEMRFASHDSLTFNQVNTLGRIPCKN